MSEKATGKLMGVCATISNKTEIDVFAVRCGVVLLCLLTTGVFVLIYFILGLFASEVE
jgi:phage shock protein PspC (stress-responsive transcriptional regulator)